MSEESDSRYDTEQYETRDEFLDSAFEGPDDYPEGAEVPEWWTWEGEAPDYEHPEQVDENTIRYVYRGYEVELSRESTAKFEARIDTGGEYGYNDVEYLQFMHEIPSPSRISGAYSGKVVIDTHQFAQHHATEAVEAFIDTEIEIDKGQEELGQALSSFDA